MDQEKGYREILQPDVWPTSPGRQGGGGCLVGSLITSEGQSTRRIGLLVSKKVQRLLKGAREHVHSWNLSVLAHIKVHGYTNLGQQK